MWRRAAGRAQNLRPFVRYQSTTNPKISTAAWAYVRLKNAMSFSGYSLLVFGGLAFTGYASWCIIDELILPSSDVRIFQRSFKMIEKDEKVREILGTKLKAHGEETHHRANRTRPIASRRTTDSHGREVVKMQFYVQGTDKWGLVKLELVDGAFRYLVIELPGYGNHYLVGGVRPKQKQVLGWLLGRA